MGIETALIIDVVISTAIAAASAAAQAKAASNAAKATQEAETASRQKEAPGYSWGDEGAGGKYERYSWLHQGGLVSHPTLDAGPGNFLAH